MGAHAAPKGKRAPDPVALQAAPLPVADDLTESPDDPRWAADLNATQPWAGPAPEPPASEAPTDPGLPVTDPDTCPHGGPAADCWPHSNTCLFESTDPGIGLGPCDPSPEWLEAVAVDREIVSFLALADKVLRESAAERAAREQDDIRDRGQAALVKYAGAMTAAAERQGGQK